MPYTTEQCYAAALTSIPYWGSRNIRALYARYGSFEAIWKASLEELKHAIPGTQRMWQSLAAARKAYDIEKEMRKNERAGIQLATYWDISYPSLLKETYNPPLVLYYWGTLPTHERVMAIVGARKATPYGLNAAETIAQNLGRHDVTIVSGGARGIDTKAHEGALHSHGKTIAVVAHGLDTIYPRENKVLFHRIVQTGGAILTEYPLGVPPLALHFPARNRIIAGISRGVIIVEAALKSGSLITADFALEEGRDVFTVPGSIFSTLSRGTNGLLRKGAIALTQSEDVLTEYGWLKTAAPNKKTAISLTLSEMAVLDALSCEQTQSLETLITLTDLPPAKLSSIILRLQLYGLVTEIGQGFYIKKPDTN